LQLQATGVLEFIVEAFVGQLELRLADGLVADGSKGWWLAVARGTAGSKLGLKAAE
jgi:hypothetical protein